MTQRGGRVFLQQLRRICSLITARSRLQHNWWPNWKAAGGGGGGWERRGAHSLTGGERETRSNEKSLLVLPPPHYPAAEGIDVSAEAFCFLRALLSPPSFTLTHGAQIHLLTFSLARVCISFLSLSSLLWMILSRNTTKSSSDTSPSSSARPHLGTSSLLKFKRHQDFHCSFRRTWGKYHTTKKNLILCAAAAEAAVNMSLKADAEPNNNVSIEEEVSWKKFLFRYYAGLWPGCAQVHWQPFRRTLHCFL